MDCAKCFIFPHFFFFFFTCFVAKVIQKLVITPHNWLVSSIYIYYRTRSKSFGRTGYFDTSDNSPLLDRRFLSAQSGFSEKQKQKIVVQARELGCQKICELCMFL